MTKTAHEREGGDRRGGKDERRPVHTSDKGDTGVAREYDKCGQHRTGKPRQLKGKRGRPTERPQSESKCSLSMRCLLRMRPHELTHARNNKVRAFLFKANHMERGKIPILKFWKISMKLG